MLGRRPLIVAHRGASAAAVDNSADAFEQAIKDGADMIEFDLRHTADGQLIAFHDPSVGDRPLHTVSHDEVAALLGYRPPLLDEILDIAEGRIGLDIELKEEGAVERVVDQLRGRFGPDGLVVTSFLHEVVRCVRAIWPQVTAGLLLDVDQVAAPQDAVDQAGACGATAVVVSHAIVQRDGVVRLTEAGLLVFVWTVDEPVALAALLADNAVTGVITNVPAEAVAIRARQHRPS